MAGLFGTLRTSRIAFCPAGAPGSGIAMSLLSGLPAALFGTAPFPELVDLPPRLGHRIAAIALGGSLAAHVGAALYHHLILKDATLRRMWRG